MRWSDEITRRLIRDQVIAASLFALEILAVLTAIDAVAERISPPEWMAGLREHPTLAQRAEFLRSLLTLFGLPTTVLVVLTSFAVPVLRPSATAGALLLHRPYRLGRADRSRLSFLRANAFYAAFVGSAGFSIACLLMVGAVAAELSRTQLPSLFAASLVGGSIAVLGIRTILWTLRMRDGVALVTHVTQLGENVIDHVGAAGRRASFRDLSPGARFSFVEQVELKLCLDTLTQQALHLTDEPAASTAALRGLRQLQDRPIDSGAVAWWRERVPAGQTGPFPEPWVEADVISTLARAIGRAVRARDTEAGRDAIASLAAIGIRLAEIPDPSPTDRRVMDLVLDALRFAFGACVEERELALRELLIAQLSQLIQRLVDPAMSATPGFQTSDASRWDGYVDEQSRRFMYALLRPCVLDEDVDAMQRVLGLVEAFGAAPRETRARVLEVVLMTAADAIAADARVGAYQVIRWLGENAVSERLIFRWAIRRVLGDASEVARPSLFGQGYVTLKDRRLAVVLPVAQAFERSAPQIRRAIRTAMRGLGAEAIEQEIDCVSTAAGLPEAVRVVWRGQFAQLDTWLAGNQ